MTIDTFPGTTATAPATKGVPSAWRAPFAAATFREFGYTLTSLPVAIAGFVFAVTLFSLGAGLAVTLLGLPVFAVMLAGARGLGAVERRRARARLGLDVAEPAPVRTAGGDSGWARVRARLPSRTPRAGRPWSSRSSCSRGG
ncbi:hypothetical protein STRAU_3141 [Streptomyces aurantiacus JA 4570]|uniref:Putative sensor domain-containing protein n=1 Tax=Streptomyces aurantiacus JA 4570 TaxID=1286094 RepID=S3ZKT5_9ACTN|nr:sensor domain-containing protein [Streptomyces aurantiacus]EPH43823.1 hypothetical protein STRAU_3141 [Streptomyces aurantiacus JA 4570]